MQPTMPQTSQPQDTPKRETLQPPDASPIKNIPTTHTKFLWKPLTIIAIFVVFISLIATAYLLSQNLRPNKNNPPEPTAISTPSIQVITPSPIPDFIDNWKTYRNQEYHYSVEYPSDWEVYEAQPRVGNKTEWTGDILIDQEIQKVTFIETIPKTWPGKFEITVQNNPGNLNTESWAKQFLIPLPADPTTNLAKFSGDIEIDNQVAKEFSVFAFDSFETLIGIVKNNQIYTFRFIGDTPNDPDLEEHNKIYDQTLSTFKFIDYNSEEVDSNSDNIPTIKYQENPQWRKYNSNFGFSLQYPPDYKSPIVEPVTKALPPDFTNSLKYCSYYTSTEDNRQAIWIYIVPYTGGSRRTLLMQLTGLYEDDIQKVQEARLSTISGLLIDFLTPYGNPPMFVPDHTAIFLKNNTALIIQDSLLKEDTSHWNSLLSSFNINENFTFDLEKCK